MESEKEKLLTFLYLLKIIGQLYNGQSAILCLQNGQGAYNCFKCGRIRKILFDAVGLTKEIIEKYNLRHNSFHGCYVLNRRANEFLTDKHVVPKLDKYMPILFCIPGIESWA